MVSPLVLLQQLLQLLGVSLVLLLLLSLKWEAGSLEPLPRLWGEDSLGPLPHPRQLLVGSLVQRLLHLLLE